MKVMVTGAKGFVGSHVVERFKAEGCEVLEHDLDSPPLEDREGADVVVSLAATADPRQAMAAPMFAYTNDVVAMVETLQYAERHGARVLQVSTNEVYGGNGRTLNPRGPYAGGKACQEIICTSSEVPTTIVVTQSLFGERQQRDKLVPTAVRSLLAGRPVTLQRNGTRWASRPFMHVRNLADALVFLAMSGEDQGLDRIHVGAMESLEVREVVKFLAWALDVEPRVAAVEAGDRPGHELEVEPIGCDLFGWQPAYPARDALVDVARWYRANP